MTEVFFNNSSQLKYGLTSYTCQQTPCFGRTFDNVIELRDHVLDYHDVDIKSIGPKYHMRSANYIQHAEEHVYNYSPPSSMNYAMIQASLFGNHITPCLDTGENVSLCDRKLLPQNQNNYDFIHRSRSITITGVTDIQICHEYIDTKILLSLNKVFV